MQFAFQLKKYLKNPGNTRLNQGAPTCTYFDEIDIFLGDQMKMELDNADANVQSENSVGLFYVTTSTAHLYISFFSYFGKSTVIILANTNIISYLIQLYILIIILLL